MYWKKLLSILGFLFLGCVIYLISVSLGYIINLSVTLIIISLFISILSVLKNNSKKYLIASIIIYLIVLLITFLPFSECSSSLKPDTLITSCDCRGLIKYNSLPGWDSQCIGIRNACYKHIDLALFKEGEIKTLLEKEKTDCESIF